MKYRLRHLPEVFGERTEKTDSSSPPRRKRGKSASDASAKNGPPSDECLTESLKLQKQLRQLTHQVLSEQEDEREKLSHKLHDDIAQTLLGINVRLLLLKRAARTKTTGLRNEIASAQRLVVKSATLVRRLARELNNHQPTPSDLLVMTI